MAPVQDGTIIKIAAGLGIMNFATMCIMLDVAMGTYYETQPQVGRFEAFRGTPSVVKAGPCAGKEAGHLLVSRYWADNAERSLQEHCRSDVGLDLERAHAPEWPVLFCLGCRQYACTWICLHAPA